MKGFVSFHKEDCTFLGIELVVFAAFTLLLQKYDSPTALWQATVDLIKGGAGGTNAPRANGATTSIASPKSSLANQDSARDDSVKMSKEVCTNPS